MAKTNQKPRGGLARAFITGLATLLPTVLTIVIITVAYNFLDEKIARPITSLIRQGFSSELAKEYFWKDTWSLQDWQLDEAIDNSGLPEKSGDIPFSQQVEMIIPNWLGFVIAIFLVLAVGIVFRGVIGRQVLKLIEGLIKRVPFIKIIYPYAKQVTEFFFEEKNKIEYDTAVAIQYPRIGIWSLGFVTSSGFRTIQEKQGSAMVAIFIPSSPTPITGYTILIPQDEVVPLNLSVDEVLRFTISGGVIVPPEEIPESGSRPELKGPKTDIGGANSTDDAPKT
ncbi:hypothetical protein CBD41_04145 [bacterium TMED181]|nr:hypothetical protein [Planctomycetota bacterium]OUW45317.1 MAG: hypothetical protein CBD41_04145 [bacterium TMED181]